MSHAGGDARIVLAEDERTRCGLTSPSPLGVGPE